MKLTQLKINRTALTNCCKRAQVMPGEAKLINQKLLVIRFALESLGKLSTRDTPPLALPRLMLPFASPSLFLALTPRPRCFVLHNERKMVYKIFRARFAPDL